MKKIPEGYKETELGVIPQQWAVKEIGTISKFQGGFAFKSEEYIDIGIPLVKIANVQQYRLEWNEVDKVPNKYLDIASDFALKENDILLAMTRPIISTGIKVCKVTSKDIPSLLNQRVGRFLLDGQIDGNFIYQFCFSPYFVERVKHLSNTTGQPNISAKQIESINIIIPPLPEQKK